MASLSDPFKKHEVMKKMVNKVEIVFVIVIVFKWLTTVGGMSSGGIQDEVGITRCEAKGALCCYPETTKRHCLYRVL